MSRLPQKTLDRYKDIIDCYLAAVPGHFRCDPVLKDAMAYALEGGKRLRGSILLSFHEALGGSIEAAIPFAAAIEMIHAYSLVHDDLPCMDDDDFRRGKPSCHKQFGYATALLAGDALLTAAFEEAASAAHRSPAIATSLPASSPASCPASPPAPSQLPHDCVVRGITVLSRAAGPSGMVGGQVLDLAMEGKTAGAGRVREMYAMKTGALFHAAARLGAILAGAPQEIEDAAGEWGSLFGYAFQVLDDLEDLRQSGKEEEKDTLAREISPAEARDDARCALREAEEALNSMRSGYPGEPPGLAVELTNAYLQKATTC